MDATAVDRLLDDGTGHRPRADARRNVERLVAAAHEAAREDGSQITAHDVARRAGVGIGTFYRRVGSLEELLKAVLDELLGEINATAERCLAAADPWEGFRDFAASYIRRRNELCDINEALGNVLDHSRADLRDRIRTLVERAQDAGALRPDVDWADVAFLLVSAATGPHTLGLRAGDAQWDRNLHVILDGLRAPGSGALPGEPPRPLTAGPPVGARGGAPARTPAAQDP